MGHSQSSLYRHTRSRTLAYTVGSQVEQESSEGITAAAFIGTLPPEVIDAIIDQFHDDYESLIACSLTCKTWLLRSRHHLFSRVFLKPKDLSAFAALVEHSPNFITPFVQRLALDDMSNCLLSCPIRQDHSHTIANIHRLESHLPGIRSLRVRDASLTAHFVETISSTFPSIEELSLDLIEFDRFFDFVDLVCAFPSLHSLSFSQVKWLHNTAPSLPTHIRRLPPSSRIRFLDLCDNNAIDVAEWLFAQDPMPAIEILHFDTHIYEPNHAVRKIIERSGPSIQHLQFDLTFANEIQENLHNSINLGLCTNLRLLHLHNIILVSGFKMTSKTSRWVPELLSQVNSPVMEEVALTLLVNRTNDIEIINWSGVGEALSPVRYTNLKKVRICIVRADPVNVDRAEVTRVIMDDKLATFRSRGILHVEFCDAEGSC